MLSELMVRQIKELKLGKDVVTEFRFHPVRRWRFDLAFLDELIAIEIEGGIYMGKGHGSIKGILRDMEKYNEAALLGWKVYRVTPEQVERGGAIALMKRVFEV